MATLWKRATPSQYVVLRIIRGAVLNVYDHHGMVRDKFFARSVAKRAAGTLTAQWPEVLAAKHQRRQNALEVNRPTSHAQGPEYVTGYLKGDRHSSLRRSPIYLIWKEIASTMWRVRTQGTPEEYAACIKLLRLLQQTHIELEAFKERNNK